MSNSTETVMQFTEEHVNKRFQAYRFLDCVGGICQSTLNCSSQIFLQSWYIGSSQISLALPLAISLIVFSLNNPLDRQHEPAPRPLCTEIYVFGQYIQSGSIIGIFTNFILYFGDTLKKILKRIEKKNTIQTLNLSTLIIRDIEGRPCLLTFDHYMDTSVRHNNVLC